MHYPSPTYLQSPNPLLCPIPYFIPIKLPSTHLTTRPQSPLTLGPESVWQRGPDFLYLPENQWPVKRDPHVNSDPSPGEKAFSHATSVLPFCKAHERTHDFSIISGCLKRTSRGDIAIGGLERICKYGSFYCFSTFQKPLF